MSDSLAQASAFVLLLAITAYSTAGGVDFGAGIWDLFAGRGPQSRRPRELIDHAMAPVWEVNNVWLVLGIVLCWTGFPLLFQSVFARLYPLFTLALIGLILRGAFFAFRHIADDPRAHHAADLVFGLSSLLTPFFFAACLGAIASGKLAFDPMSAAFGLVSLAATAFSGGSWSRRAIIAGFALIGIGTLALGAIGLEAPSLLRSMLVGAGLPFVLATMILTPLVIFLLWRGIYVWYRVMTVAAIGSMVFAWGFAQSPYLVPGQLTISQAAAPLSTHLLLLAVAAVLVLVIGPAMALLYYLDQRGELEPPEASI